ncbi:MAG: hypothetical protein RhofKO_29910 [Rhodothermales bacterium]
MTAFRLFTKTIGRKISFGYVLALALAIGIGTIAYTSISSLNQTAGWVTHTYEVLAELETIESGLKDAETGQRGYLLTGNPKYLDPYNSAREVVDEAVAQIWKLTSNIPAQQERIGQLEPLIEAKFNELQETIDLRREAGFEAALAVVLTDQGKVVMDQMRGLLGEMESTERDLLAVRDQDVATTSSDAVRATVAITILAIVLLTLVGFLTVRSIVKPVRELATKSKRVADGDLAVEAHVASHDEIGQLAVSFNAMVENLRSSITEGQAQQRLAEEGMRKAEALAKAADAQQAYLDRSVKQLLVEIDRFAQGDLTVSLAAERDDEIGQLYAGFSDAVGNIRELFAKVQRSVDETVATAVQISSAAEELSAGAQEQSAQASEVAAAVGQMTTTIVTNANTTSATAEVSAQNGEAAKVGRDVVTQTVQKIQTIARVVGQSAETVERLGVSSQQIGEIVSTIDEIADQTNLLALNAAIEAARAGEQGRGFAVVADEVRKLAERTTAATKQIAEMIKMIQAETNEAVKSIQQGTQEANSGIILADKAGAALNQIVEHADETVGLITQIASATEEQSVTSEQISRTVEAISLVSRDSAQSVTEIAQSATELSRLMDELEHDVARFKVKRNEMAVMVRQAA